MTKGKLTFKDFLSICGKPTPAPDPLEVLGKNLLKLPQAYWQEHMLFSGALNTDLLEKTGGFPATFKDDSHTHPVFVVRKLGRIGFKLCPCTSKKKKGCRYILKGCRLEIKETVTDRHSYLLEEYTFNLSYDPSFCRNLHFKGRVPSMCIAECNPSQAG